MSQSSITVVINGNTFSLRADDGEAIAAIPAAERGQLIALLEAVKQQEARVITAARGAPDKRSTVSPTAAPTPGPERMGSGDVDALMARLVMEENSNRKPGPTRQGIYRGLLYIGAAIALLLLIF